MTLGTENADGNSKLMLGHHSMMILSTKKHFRARFQIGPTVDPESLDFRRGVLGLWFLRNQGN